MRLLSNKMSHVDSDLEEGEIPDDSPSSPMFNVKSSKELPRRYAIRETKGSHHKHKKSCKHSPYNTKKKYKFKKAPTKGKGDHKSHQTPSTYHGKSSSCKIHGNILESKKNHKNNNAISPSLVAKRRNPLVDHKLSPKSTWSDSGVFYSKIVETINDNSFDEMLLKYKTRRKNSHNSVHHSNQMSQNLKNSEGQKSIDNVSIRNNVVKDSCIVLPPEPLDNKREKNYNEELERIALTSCTKQKTNLMPSERVNSALNGNNTLPAGSSVYNNISSVQTNGVATDNYEVLDMDVDEFNQNSIETDDDCIIIAVKPPVSCQNRNTLQTRKKNPKNSNSISPSSSAKQRSPLEDHSASRLSPKSSWSDSEGLYTKIVETINDNSFDEMVLKYKTMRKNLHNSVRRSNQMSHSFVTNSEVQKKCIENVSLINNVVKDSCIIPSPEPLDSKREESEDENELRRIALATCKKRKTSLIPSKSLNSALNDNNTVSLPAGSSVSSNISSVQMNDTVTDNYEVVDMDVEKVNLNLKETTKDDCFIIDTKPSLDCQNSLNPVSNEQKVKNISDEEFEEDILRAEIIEDMYRKKMTAEECVRADKYPEKVNDIQRSSPHTEKQILQKHFVKSAESPKPSFDKPVLEPKQSPKRLIISLNGESSSSEESEQEERLGETLNDNPVASIEALISGIRQKSELGETNNFAVNVVPKAVECLSKAQQEEYNALKKILATKNKISIPHDKTELKNKAINSPIDNLKSLEEKLMGVRETLNKKIELMSDLSKEVNSKKFLYIKSRLATQHLKEKYIAAERQRRINLNAWSKSCKILENAEKTVTDLQNRITELQDKCSDLGFSIQGKNYSLPPVRTENG